MSRTIGLVHGISAALAYASGFYLAGLVVSPLSWTSVLGFPAFLVIGVSLYVVAGIAAVIMWGIPLTGMMAFFVAGLLILGGRRFRHVRTAVVAHMGSRGFARGVLAFAAFFTALHVAALPSDANRFLPAALPEHIDLVTHARYARHLLLAGSSNLEEAPFAFSRAPAVAAVLAGFSVFFNEDPLRAAVPLTLAIVALAGVAVLSICRSLFGLSAIASLTIALLLLTSAYVTDITQAYRLDAAIAAAIVLYLFWVTARIRADEAAGPVALSVAGGYGILFLTVASVVPAILTLQAVLIGSRMFAPRLRVAGAVVMSTRMRLSVTDQRLVAALTVYVGIALILTNVVAHASARRSTPTGIPVGWRNVERLKQGSPREVTMKVGRNRGGLVAAVTRYYLPQTKLGFILPGVPIPDYGAPSRETPLVIQSYPCEAVGHSDVIAIPDVGCVLLAPPSLVLETSYPFNRPFLAVEFDNLGDPEPGGRRNLGKPLRLSLIADAARTQVDMDLHVNLLVNPPQPAGMKPHRLSFAWGAGKRATGELSGPGWISVPVSSADWSRARVWMLPISVEFPDGGTVLFQELSLSKTASGVLVH